MTIRKNTDEMRKRIIDLWNSSNCTQAELADKFRMPLGTLVGHLRQAKLQGIEVRLPDKTARTRGSLVLKTRLLERRLSAMEQSYGLLRLLVADQGKRITALEHEIDRRKAA